MAYKIQKHLTSVNKGEKGSNKPEWIIYHFVGASGQALANANYFRNVYRGASAHYFIDPTTIVQVVEDDRSAWHIGDGSRTRAGKHNGYVHPGGATNSNAIGIECCQDTSTGNSVWNWQFHPETLNKAEWLIKKLQKKYNIDDDHVIRHYDASTKLCPGNWQGNGWARWWNFKKRLATGIKQPTPSKKPGNEGKSDEKNMYLVQPGDTLSAIAKKHNVTVKQLTAWNDLDDPNLIIPETKIFVKKPAKPSSNKNIDKLAQKVINGEYKSGDARKKALGSKYEAVQKRVNEILLGKVPTKPKGKSVAQMANMILNGKNVPNGHTNRRKWLGISQSQYDKVRAEVNRLAGGGSSSGGKSVSQMADMILNGKNVPNGHANRRKWLGVSQSQYNKVRAEVNKRVGGGGSKSSGKSVSQMANMIINGKNVPNGHAARQKWLGVNNATYQKVRAEVNRRL